MVLFWLMWLCLVLWGAARLLGDRGRVGLWLAAAPGAALPHQPRRGRRVGGRWPPGGESFPFGPRAVPRAGPGTVAIAACRWPLERMPCARYSALDRC
jgi:hypothetical protein